jgi:hypothetical protein
MADGTTPEGEPPTEEPKYDQDFFLALAAKGKDEWNAWRRTANKDVHVTFAGIDSSEAPKDRIDFSGFEFGEGAGFSGCKWFGYYMGLDHDAFAPGRAYFTNAKFGSGANFSGAKLGYSATFTGAIFGDKADFSDSRAGLLRTLPILTERAFTACRISITRAISTG